MKNMSLSLSDLLGKAYTEAVCEARAFVTGEPIDDLRAVAEEKVDFAPARYQQRLDELVDVIGTQVCPGLGASAAGARLSSCRSPGTNPLPGSPGRG